MRSIATTSLDSSTTQSTATVAPRVAADPALLVLGDVAADRAEADLVLDLDEHVRQPLDVDRVGVEQVERDPLRTLGADAGQPAELVDQVLDDAFVHGAARSARRREAGRSRPPARSGASSPRPRAPPASGPICSAASALGLVGGVADRRHHHVAEGLGVVGIAGLRLDRHRDQVAGAGDGRGHEAAGRRALHPGLGQPLLGRHQLLLQALGLGEQRGHVGGAACEHDSLLGSRVDRPGSSGRGRAYGRFGISSITWAPSSRVSSSWVCLAAALDVGVVGMCRLVGVGRRGRGRGGSRQPVASRAAADPGLPPGGRAEAPGVPRTGRRPTRPASRRRARRSSTWRSTSSQPLRANESRLPALTNATVRVLPSSACTCALWLSSDQASRRADLVRSTTSGQARRTSTRPRAEAAGRVRGPERARGQRPRLPRRARPARARPPARVRARVQRPARGAGAGCGAARLPARAVGGLGRRLGGWLGRRLARRGRGGGCRTGCGAGAAASAGGVVVVGTRAAPWRGGRPSIAIRRSIRSRRACTPSTPSSAAGSSTRAHISSSSSRGAVAPRISPSAVATTSAARTRSAAPKRAACPASRSPCSGPTSSRPSRAASGTWASTIRSRSRVSRSSTNRRGSRPPSTTRSTMRKTAPPSPAANASTTSSSSDSGVKPSSPVASAYVSPSSPAPPISWSSDAQGVAGGPAAGPYDQRQRRRLDRDALALADLGEVVAQQPRRQQPERVVVGAGADRRRAPGRARSWRTRT